MSRFLSLALVAAVLVGCDTTSSDSSVQDVQEKLPREAFVLSTNAFPAEEAGTPAGDNYLAAAAHIGAISTIVGEDLAMPAAATEAVTENEPTLEEGGGRVWSSTVDMLGTPVPLRLEAATVDSELAWRLDSNEDTEAPFTYYTATTSMDGLSGAWDVFRPDANGTVLKGTFDVRSLRHREIVIRVPGGRDHAGSRVRYSTSGSEQTFDWTAQPGGDHALIVWDTRGRAGSITADTHNGGVRACWDESLQDVGC